MKHADEWYTSHHQAVAFELTDLSVGGWADCLDLVEQDQHFIAAYARTTPSYLPYDLARQVKARRRAGLTGQA